MWSCKLSRSQSSHAWLPFRDTLHRPREGEPLQSPEQNATGDRLCQGTVEIGGKRRRATNLGISAETELSGVEGLYESEPGILPEIFYPANPASFLFPSVPIKLRAGRPSASVRPRHDRVAAATARYIRNR